MQVKKIWNAITLGCAYRKENHAQARLRFRRFNKEVTYE